MRVTIIITVRAKIRVKVKVGGRVRLSVRDKASGLLLSCGRAVEVAVVRDAVSTMGFERVSVRVIVSDRLLHVK